VIISIIGGDDMKLLEVDEAANHIRELVDPNANIIWGSAFNPDLGGKIRVSVVATGIEQSAEQAEVAARPLSLGMSRGPVLPTAAAAAPTVEPLFSEPAPAEPEPEAETAPLELADEAMELEDAADDDRSDETTTVTEPDEEADSTEADDGDQRATGAYASLTEVKPAKREPLDLALDQVDDEPETTPQDDLLLDASRLAAEDGPISPMSGRRRGLVSEAGGGGMGGGGGGGGGSPVAGNTLFERMANLSRGVKPADDSDDEDDDEGGASISIPRFLGRQNNQ
jgi:cell division protein FtsZ